MICAPFDRNTGEIETTFTILKVADDSSLVLKLENIGQLHLPTANPVVQATPTVTLSIDTPTSVPTNKAP